MKVYVVVAEKEYPLIKVFSNKEAAGDWMDQIHKDGDPYQYREETVFDIYDDGWEERR